MKLTQWIQLIQRSGPSLAIAACLISAAPGTWANPQVHGFGSFGVTSITGNDYYNSDYNSTRNQVSYTLDSKFGINLSNQLNPRTRLFLQPIFLGTSTYKPQVDLAFVSLNLDSHSNLFVGRIVAPIWMFSEEQSIGYSLPWVRPPALLYKALPFRNLDGVGLRFNDHFAGIGTRMQIFGGGSSIQTVNSLPNLNSISDITVKDILGSELVLENDESFAVRLAYVVGKTSLVLTNTVPTLVSGNLIASNVLSSVDLGTVKFASAGIKGRWDRLSLVAENANIMTESAAYKNYGAQYATLGFDLNPLYRIHTTYSTTQSVDGSLFMPLDDSTLTDRLKSSSSTSIGLNFSGFDNVVLKADVTNHKYIYNLRSDNNLTVYSFVADMVF